MQAMLQLGQDDLLKSKDCFAKQAWPCWSKSVCAGHLLPTRLADVLGWHCCSMPAIQYLHLPRKLAHTCFAT